MGTPDIPSAVFHSMNLNVRALWGRGYAPSVCLSFEPRSYIRSPDAVSHQHNTRPHSTATADFGIVDGPGRPKHAQARSIRRRTQNRQVDVGDFAILL